MKFIIFFLIFIVSFCNKTPELKDYGKVENFTLINQENQKVEFYSLNDKPILLFFGFTHCPDYCPITLSKLSKIYKSIEENKKPYIVFITVDPERDTPDVIKEYLKKFDAKIIGLTGTSDEIRSIANKLGVYIRIEKKFDHIHVEHNTSTFLIDKNFHIRYIFSFKEPETTFKKVLNAYF